MIQQKGIFTKFSVIGIANHEAGLMNELLEIGTERGIYCNVNPQ